MGTYGKHQTKNLKFLVHQERPRRAKIGTYGKHQTKNLKFLVHQERPRRAKIGTYGKHQTKNLQFLVHQERPRRAKIGTLGPMANIKLRIYNSWYTRRGHQGQKLGDWDLWQASD